jgi:hypothetical protein
MAADAVAIEPVSKSQITVKWENIWEFFEKAVRFDKPGADSGDHSAGCS